MLQTARHIFRISACERGAVAIEWAFLAPVLILLLTGVADFALAAHHKTQMANALRAGLQYATVRKPVQGDLSGIENAILAASPHDATGTREISVSMYCECPDAQAVSCGEPCPAGSRQAFVAAEMREDYRLLLALPLIPDPLSFVVTGNVRLN